VSNLPYYLTGYILELLTSSTTPPFRAVLTVQLEVAERLTAEAGQHTLLSIMIALFGRVSMVRTITRLSFWPAPKVDSAVILIERHPTPVVPLAEEKWLLRVVKAGFAARRKMLSNALSGGLRKTPGVILAALKAVGLQENARAQELTIEQWAQLSRHLSAA